MKKVIIVNGIPASGKSTVAQQIATYFNFPYLSIDVIKEPFMALHENIDRAFNREIGKAAYQVIWDTVSSAPEGCVYVIDAWFGFQSKDVFENYLNASSVTEVVEVWNQISPECVAERYRSRLSFRKEGHPGEEYIPELMELAQNARPMGIGALHIVEQDNCVDVSVILDALSTPFDVKNRLC
jgi:predicted NBD/HSP70 family sugar kinase